MRGLAALSLSSVPILGACRSGTVATRTETTRSDPPSELVQRIRGVPTIDGKGATLNRIFPTPYLQNLDPFVLLDDFEVGPPAGFPTHPHRGFEAFTYMLDGAFHHRDNLGNDSVIGAGGTQRFTSGRGAFHSEMPGTDGVNRGLQLWVNLPRRLKTMSPNYAGEPGDNHPERREHGYTARTIVGDGSPVELQTAVRYYDVSLQAGATFSNWIETGWNGLVYVIQGSIEAAGMVLRERDGILPREGSVTLAALTVARVLFLSGKPHHEPINHRGPFVD